MAITPSNLQVWITVECEPEGYLNDDEIEGLWETASKDWHESGPWRLPSERIYEMTRKEDGEVGIVTVTWQVKQ